METGQVQTGLGGLPLVLRLSEGLGRIGALASSFWSRFSSGAEAFGEDAVEQGLSGWGEVRSVGLQQRVR